MSLLSSLYADLCIKGLCVSGMEANEQPTVVFGAADQS